MESQSIYRDIARRTGGDIYIGVVGPVRTGKSTFIKRFMESLVLPRMKSDLQRERATDELPQSAAGKTIMTTEPKFIPEEAAQIQLDDHAVMRVRLIDCVGYIVPSSLGYFENEAPRMVRTPWFDEEVPFNMAAEVGTGKVITDHSTIGLVITTDGSISDIPRDEYEEAEERVISELAALGKPFVVLLNCVEPHSPAARTMAEQLTQKYGRPVLPVSCLSLGEEDIRGILQQMLYEFPLKEVQIQLPRWTLSLAPGHWLRDAVFGAIRESAASVEKLGETAAMVSTLPERCSHISRAQVDQIDLGQGLVQMTVTLQPQLFYQILGEATGLDIADETRLMPCLMELAACKKAYDRLKGALEQVEATGYGIVMPQMTELTLEEPEIVRQGGRYGVRLRASAPSIHLISTRIATEISPIVGSEKQSEELVASLLRDFEEDPVKIWDSNIFGKSLHELVGEGLHAKLGRMPQEARMKLQETIERIINEGCNGLVCLIL